MTSITSSRPPLQPTALNVTVNGVTLAEFNTPEKLLQALSAYPTFSVPPSSSSTPLSMPQVHAVALAFFHDLVPGPTADSHGFFPFPPPPPPPSPTPTVSPPTSRARSQKGATTAPPLLPPLSSPPPAPACNSSAVSTPPPPVPPLIQPAASAPSTAAPVTSKPAAAPTAPPPLSAQPSPAAPAVHPALSAEAIHAIVAQAISAALSLATGTQPPSSGNSSTSTPVPTPVPTSKRPRTESVSSSDSSSSDEEEAMVDVGQNVDPLSASDLSLRRYLNQVQTFVSNIRSQTEHPLGRGTFHSTPDLVDQMQSLASEAQRSATSYCRAWTRIFSAQSYLSSHIADSVAIVDTMLGGSHTGSLSSRDRRRLDRHVKSLRLRRSGQTANLHSIRRTGSRPPAASPSSSFRSGAPHGENRTARALVPEADRCLHCKHKYSRHSPADCRSKCDAAGSGKCTRDQCK